MPINYLERIKTYYQTLGYGKPYQWANYEKVPFNQLRKPLGSCRIALLTTAAPFRPEAGDQGPGARYNSAAKFYSVYAESTDGRPDMRIAHVGYDRKHTSAEDQNTWFPLEQLKIAMQQNRIGDIAPRFYGVPTNRSQRTTLERDCPAVLKLVQQDQVDAAVLIPNCPVCHQSCSLVARHLEQHGIATVIMGCAKDIVETVGVPRFLFSDFPLGNGAGKPHDIDSQFQTLDLALNLLTTATVPRTTQQSPLRWADDSAWKMDFYNIDRLSSAEIGTLRKDFDQQKQIASNQRIKEGL